MFNHVVTSRPRDTSSICIEYLGAHREEGTETKTERDSAEALHALQIQQSGNPKTCLNIILYWLVGGRVAWIVDWIKTLMSRNPPTGNSCRALLATSKFPCSDVTRSDSGVPVSSSSLTESRIRSASKSLAKNAESLEFDRTLPSNSEDRKEIPSENHGTVVMHDVNPHVVVQVR